MFAKYWKLAVLCVQRRDGDLVKRSLCCKKARLKTGERLSFVGLQNISSLTRWKSGQISEYIIELLHYSLKSDSIFFSFLILSSTERASLSSKRIFDDVYPFPHLRRSAWRPIESIPFVRRGRARWRGRRGFREGTERKWPPEGSEMRRLLLEAEDVLLNISNHRIFYLRDIWHKWLEYEHYTYTILRNVHWITIKGPNFFINEIDLKRIFILKS